MNEDTKFLIDLVMKASNLITDEIEINAILENGFKINELFFQNNTGIYSNQFLRI